MSGHSKWATTKRKKWAEDAKRSSLFTKLANTISIAARTGGDPETNFALRIAIEKAKAASMPKENIERVLRRAQGGVDGAAIEEVIYEGYGPGGVAILIQCLTDNRLRTISAIRAVFNKFGGSLAEAGSVSYLFEKKGQIIIKSKSEIRNPNDETKMENFLEETIIDSGADDFEVEEDTIIVYTGISQLQSVLKFFQDAGVKTDSSDIIYEAKSIVAISEEKKASIEKLLEALSADDDVNEVYTNLE